MKSDENTPWKRLVSAARSAPADTNVEAPFGFSSRVVARADSAARLDSTSLLARFALPALGVAALIAAATAAANLKPVLDRTDDDVAALADTSGDSGDLSV